MSKVAKGIITRGRVIGSKSNDSKHHSAAITSFFSLGSLINVSLISGGVINIPEDQKYTPDTFVLVTVTFRGRVFKAKAKIKKRKFKKIVAIVSKIINTTPGSIFVSGKLVLKEIKSLVVKAWTKN